MWELRFVSVSDDAEHIIVSSPDLDGEEFLLAINDELRDALAPPARPRRPDPAPDEPLTPREIQSRIRAGQSPQELAEAAGVSLAKVERFAGPVLTERAHMAEAARAARVTWHGESAEPRSLESVVTARLEVDGATDLAWDAWRREDGVWMVQVAYELGGQRHTAEWTWETTRRQLRPYGAAARALSSPAAATPAPEPPAPGLRMVPASPGPRNIPTPHGSPAHPAAAVSPSTGAGAEPEEDGVTRRAAVPSWDDIIFGVRRSDH